MNTYVDFENYVLKKVIMVGHKNNVLNTIGIPIVEHCNLNCKGCLHFCNKSQKEYYYNLNQLDNDLQRLHELFESVLVIRVYGGEPLLHPQLKEIFEAIRNIFPNCELQLLTNGMLLNTSKCNLFLEMFIEYDVQINWSVYQVMNDDTYIKIAEKLLSKSIKYKINKIEQFSGMLNPYGTSIPRYAWERCNGKKCHMIRNGLISQCPAPLVSHLMNEFFNLNVTFTDSIIDIYERHINSESVTEFLNKPHDICRFCAPPRYYKWGLQEKLDVRDWYGRLL